MGTRSPIIITENLTKHYGSVVAVQDLNLKIYEGEIFGLLGPNGAGKTTTILMLLGLTEPTAGRALVAGLDPTRNALAVKRLVGYLPDNVGFYDDLTAKENLLYTGRLNQIPETELEHRVKAALEQVGLADHGDRKVREFSRGMRQRLGIADLIVKDPRIFILDEPTLGIDPEGVRELLALIVRLSREKGKTILISSHLLHQIQQICDRVGIFVAGRLLAVGPLESLGRQVMAGKPLEIELQVEPFNHGLLEVFRSLEGVEQVETQGPYIRLRCVKGQDVRPQLTWLLAERKVSILHLRARGHDLDDIYLEYFQGEGRV
ncbi:ABC-2 type transport system ATP-binding protein [Thermanaeromonas toyohensis ToBE]|uniref:ABC-2 type transport system ATP-binding protein n=1 Tax=Thermanaeromonas toyohensis ToBE TaxID=698762 RepID=A0A1W1W1I1_9FIRM|nr:ABC transporter ATP-binding protein [Thermanaeromonas toyohensis]SMB99373.1 ABC-2 type transport system ATP-binding protein [Thermanaeromonas toyohensis ToBE]